MIKIFLLFICVSASLANTVFGQTKVIKKEDLLMKNTWEEISVLKSNQTIREGIYKRIIKGKLSLEGTYKNGLRAGIWKTYDGSDQLELEINYDSGLVKYRIQDTLTKANVMRTSQLVPTGDRPILNITGSNTIEYILELLQYPESVANDGITGKSIVSIKINSMGSIIDYFISSSADNPDLDAEALRVVKLMPFDFLPVYKNGVAIEWDVKIPIEFTIN